MLSSTLMLPALGVLILLLVVAYVCMPAQQKQSIATAVTHSVPHHFSQRERDIIEDGAMIAASYEETARAQLRQAALDRHRDQLNQTQAQQVAMANIMANFGVAGANASSSRKSTS